MFADMTRNVLNNLIEEYGNAMRLYNIDYEQCIIIYTVVEEDHIYVYENNGHGKKVLFCYPLR